jgi:hypothetical protein
MKNLFLILTACAFFVSCRTEAQIQNSDPAESPKNTNEPIQMQAKDLPVDSAEADVEHSKIGTIQSGKQSVCLSIENANLNIGDKIQIVITELPQKFFEAEISEKSFCEEKNFGTLDAGNITEYILKSADKNFLDRGYGIGIVSTRKMQMKGKFATIDLNGDEKPEYFRECTSMEGLHLTVWTGKPLAGKGIWHAYYGLGYDTVPTCRKKDFYGKDD